ncbi:glycosyltransferase [Maribacter stanieri]|uniref:glycosyltransferase n=1 Tax=Maribacter stanieri TaxID=440514 RepID=UPI0024959FBA|nr:glycosyltransferase [Maribacter stanieri]
MKILHIIDRMEPARGGTCQAVRSIISGLAEFQHSNEVLCLDAPDNQFHVQDSFRIHALGPANNPLSYSIKIKPWLQVNLEKFDIIISHGLWQYPGYAAFSLWKRITKQRGTKDNYKIKFFVMPHGMLDPYFQIAPGRKFKAIRNKLYWQVIESKVVNGADGILFTAEEELRLASQPFTPYKPNLEAVVGLGVESPPEFTPKMKNDFTKKCPKLKEDNYLLFLSRVHEKKGIDLLIKAYSKIFKETLKNSKIVIPKLVIAGPGLDSTYGQQMVDLIKTLELPTDIVLFVGMLTGNAKWGAFYGCESFVLPSHQENFGIALVEALACSKPVLISNKINIWREIESAGGGFVADDSIEGTENSLARWIALTKQEKSIIGKKARYTFEQYFTVSGATEKLSNSIIVSN